MPLLFKLARTGADRRRLVPLFIEVLNEGGFAVQLFHYTSAGFAFREMFRERVIPEEPNSWFRNAHNVHAMGTTEPLQIDQKIVSRLVLEVTVCVLCVRSVV